ncbi:2-oxoacid:ferredoxin oxidoreductase subunit beta [Candidatus Aerophobetes bacterium]|uniref:2-oxoacid:ferredoxin oxidoreductase subunit beta n=1 Tax=Aerophobetes bacterium TaxID=2030807 RepID=A0A497E2E2_UNCAE|nr:MAG: 2-oxoacid:ferredoxin oxidoreductase subunit beta [Candidatus Aerophobetes bacterium]
MSTVKHPRSKYLREDLMPHTFCPGCGIGQLMNYLTKALDDLSSEGKIDLDKVVIVAGVGCAARLPIFMNFECIHGIHGRELAFATGIKLANPNLHVIAVLGDGAAANIGANHFIQACRRNVGITTIVVNNRVFAMTGGEVSATTPKGVTTSTSPYGNIERPFDLCKLAEAAGATFIARWTTAHPFQLINTLKKAITHKGFSVVEVVSQCVTFYGRRVYGVDDPAVIWKKLKEESVPIEQARKMSPEDLRNKIIVGEFKIELKPTFEEEYYNMVKRIREGR